MNANQITSMLTLGQLAIDFNNASKAAIIAKYCYYKKLRSFDGVYGNDDRSIRLNPNDECCADLINHSKAEYKEFQTAKRNVYNIKRRIAAACKKAGA